MTPEAAETLALQALGYIAADQRLLEGLQGTTGLEAETLRAGVGDPEILAGVLDFLLKDERQLVLFCEHADIDPRLPGRARYVITGEAPYE